MHSLQCGFVLLILSCVIVVNNATHPCPARCLCFRTTVRCMFLQLERIPPIPSNTTILDLRFNKIKDIQPNSFQNLKELNTLLLNNNHITRLQDGAFNGLREMRHLYLYKNRIREIESRVFHGLNKLEQLYLHFNDLVEILPDTFSNLPSLERLFLQHNKLQRIPAGAFRNMVSLKRLRLDSNALICDCEMVWLVKLLKDQMKSTQAAATCQQPNDMQGKSLASVSEDDFHCKKPEIKEQPHDVELTFGGTVYFTCKAEGDPEPDIVWLRNSNEVSFSDPRYSVLKDGTLMIENALLEDVGVYECMAKNPAGDVKSRSAVMRVSGATVKPRFVKTPEDQHVVQGKSVTLQCEVTGQPTPDITWTKDGRNIIQSDRIKVTSNGSLLILDAKKEDSGSYRCSASNYLGRIHAIGLLKVNAAPVLVEAPRNETVLVGGAAQFRCVAEGHPPPTISWFREGQLIASGGNVALLANGQILRIEKVKAADAGPYTCSAKNAAGRLLAGAWLIVHVVTREPPTLQHAPYDMSVPPGATIEVPCSASGNPQPTISWRKDSVPVDEDGRHRVSSVGSLYVYNVSNEDSGEYACYAVNEHGQISAKGIVTVRGVAVVAGPGDRFVQRAFQEAQRSVDRAVNDTLNSLFSRTTPATPGELLRILRYPNAEARQVARAAEIYEITLANVRKHVLSGMKLNLTGNDFSYRELLSANQLEVIANLSGCMAHRTHVNCDDMCFHAKYRTLDGTCNNLGHPMWGASLIAFSRLLPSEYENGFNLPIGWTKSQKYFGYSKPSARLISTRLISTTEITPDHTASHMLMQWGQFLDHDLDHAIPSLSGESYEEGIACKGSCEYASPCYPIEIPPNDPRGRAGRCMDFVRSSAICGSGGTSVLFDSVNPREQINQLTSFIDASQIYGFSESVTNDLRDFTTHYGLMRTSTLPRVRGPLLPLAERDFMDCRRDPRESQIGCFLAGDVRANEQVALLAMHTIWLREHNRVATELRRVNPHWDSDVLFHEARKVVGAEMQHITYTHWLPHILGPEGMRQLGPYTGYKPTTDPRIVNEFATAALRFGHTMINPVLDRLNGSFHPISEGPLPLHKAFFSPWRLVDEGGVDPLMRGLLFSPAKLKTPHQNLNSDLTERLFSAAHSVALDLAAINIQRGRDHGLPGYNEYRRICNLTVAETFNDLRNEIRSAAVRDRLKELYGHPGNIDLWVGGILEEQMEGAKIGPTLMCILVDQFKRLRDGDRFWYENPSTFKPEQLTQLKQVSMSTVLCDNGEAIDRVTNDVFLLPSRQSSGIISCSSLPKMDLRMWSECCHDCSSAGRFNSITRHPVGRLRRNTEYSYPSEKPPTLTHYDNTTMTPELTSPTSPAKFINSIEPDMEEEEEERIEGMEEMLHNFQKTLKQLKKKIRKLENHCEMKQKRKNHHKCVDDEGHSRLNGETWKMDACTQCHCQEHQITCTRNMCPPLICDAPSVPTTTPGECCAICSPPSKA